MKKYCRNCGYIGSPRYYTPGGCFIELFLWLCFIVPGVIYTLWRWSRTSRSKCPNCGQINTMIPMDSPATQQILSATVNAPKAPVAESSLKNQVTEEKEHEIILPPRDETGRFIIE